jgi:hypothetical protein
MSTGTEIIQGAMERIGAHSIHQPAEPEDIIKGMSILNSMLQLWISWGVDIQTVPIDAPGQDLSEPPDAKNAIMDNLAIYMAPNFDNGKLIVSPTLMANATRGITQIRTLYRKFKIPRKRPSSTLPRGAGNSKGSFRRDIFFGDDESTRELDA